MSLDEIRNFIFWASLIGAVISVFRVCVNDYNDRSVTGSYISTFAFSALMALCL